MMTIIEAEKEIEILRKKIDVIRKEYDFGSWANVCGLRKSKPLQERANKLASAIIKAKEITQVCL